MTCLLLRPESGLSITSATNTVTSKDYLLRDELGLDTRFSTDTVIVIDRGAANASNSWDTIAFVQSTISTSATVAIEYSNSATFASGVTTIAAATVPITSPTSSRRRIHIHQLASATTHRYIRVTFASTSGGFDLGRIITGVKIMPEGVAADATRFVDDRSTGYEVGAYSTFEEKPILSGWKVVFHWRTETDFRSVWFPFFHSVGRSKPFLFVPVITDAATVQSDWCYGRITTATTDATHRGHDLWVYQVSMRSIYP